MKINFHNKNFALSLAFIMRFKATRKWPISYKPLASLLCSILCWVSKRTRTWTQVSGIRRYMHRCRYRYRYKYRYRYMHRYLSLVKENVKNPRNLFPLGQKGDNISQSRNCLPAGYQLIHWSASEIRNYS